MRKKSVKGFNAYIGKRIKEFRNDDGITQIQLAREIKSKHSYISALENGKLNPNLKTLEKICKVLKCTVRDLFP